MPTSRSRKPGADTPPPKPQSRYLWLLVLLGVIAVLWVAVVALPASLIGRVLPPSVHAEDFSGSLWHGSAARLKVKGRDAGALEWRLHPAALLALTVSADIHWVDLGFVADARASVDRHTLDLRDLMGGGPLEDLAAFGIVPGWRGITHFKISEFKMNFPDLARSSDGASLLAAVGDVGVADLMSPQFAAGADLGGYSLHMTNGAVTPDSAAAAELADTGGPLEVAAAIHFSPKERTALLSGTIKERREASAALRGELDNLLQLHARDANGRIPFELEFSL